MNFKEKANMIKINLPAVFLAMKHEKTPWMAKTLAGITVTYALSPIDLIPDFVPVLGYLDDIIILPLLIALTVKFIPVDVMAECRLKAQDLWVNGKPKHWLYAVPIVLLWLLVVWWLASIVFRKR